MLPAMTRRLAAEALGTAMLLAIVIGSGIMGQRLSAGNDAIALLGNTIATGAGLVVGVVAVVSGEADWAKVTVARSARWMAQVKKSKRE